MASGIAEFFEKVTENLFEGKIEKMPMDLVDWSSAEQRRVRDRNVDMMEGRIDTPTLQVAGMTGLEGDAGSLLSQIIGTDTYADPATSGYWKGLRAEMTATEQSGIEAIRRQGQAAGMFGSSAAFKAEGSFRAESGRNRATLLGELTDRERRRSIENQQRRAAMGFQFGGLGRQIENQQNMAQYTNAFDRFNAQNQAADRLAGYNPFVQQQYRQTPSTMEKIAGILGLVLQGVKIRSTWKNAGSGGGGGGGSSGTGAAIGNLGGTAVGMGVGAALAAPTGGLSMLAGAGIGGGIGGSSGGTFGGLFD